MRPTTTADFPAIIALCQRVYPESVAWSQDQLASHLRLFPEGQVVAVVPETGRLVGMAASLVIWWDDYDVSASWREFTDHGFFGNHDPARGRTLYGAEIMVDPEIRRRGVGKAIYAARRALAQRLGLLRIR
ncbi:MAG: GNAT family N-acetyltransferase, partial [Thermoanaerobaculia bacterium]